VRLGTESHGSLRFKDDMDDPQTFEFGRSPATLGNGNYLFKVFDLKSLESGLSRLSLNCLTHGPFRLIGLCNVDLADR
jgi:hypothetical protein